MAPLTALLSEYGESHQNPTNKLVHWVCVPLIMFSLIGLLWSIPVPIPVRGISYLFNWGNLAMLVPLVYYVRLSPRLALGMVLVWVAMAAVLSMVVDYAALPLWAICLIIFALAWMGQFWGHKVEGKKPSFLKDLQFLLIGPLWLLHFVYRRLGWEY